MQLLWLIPYGVIFLAVQRMGLDSNQAQFLTVALLTVYWAVLFLCIRRKGREERYGLGVPRIRNWKTHAMLIPLLLMPVVNLALGTFQMTALTAVYIVYTAFGEEFFFRGYLLGVLRNQYGIWVSSAISAVLFGLMHCFSNGSWIQILCAAGVGFALAASRFLTGSLIVPVLVHIFINLTGWQSAPPGYEGVYLIVAAVYAAWGILMLRKAQSMFGKR